MIKKLLRLPVKWRDILAGMCVLFVIGVGCLWHAVPDPTQDVVSWPISPVLLDNKGHLIHARLSSDGEWCLPVPLEEMGEWLPLVLVTVEDKRFYEHGGVDFLALGRAVVQNITQGRVVSGASTITSQLIRLSQPRKRTFQTKLFEFIGAWKLERFLSKDEILEYYLNRAPFGGPIRGVEAASRQYFGKRSKELSLGEASFLVAMLKGPTAYRPDRNPKSALARRQKIIRLVAERYGYSDDMLQLALAEPLPQYRPVMPMEAWHFAEHAFKLIPTIQGKPMGGIIRSSLDSRLQRALEQRLVAKLGSFSSEVTASGLIVDNQTASIVAYVGNARFFPEQKKDWVDCATARRSPGSALKPFVYLAALEKGLIIPATMLADTPLQFAGEAPRNFDRKYRGPVSAQQALASSLNVPAVRVQRMLGVREVLLILQQACFSHLDRDLDVYGDSLVLGAGEATLVELARAYTAIASNGADRPLRLLAVSEDSASGQSSSVLERYGSTLSHPAVRLEQSKRHAASFPEMLPAGLSRQMDNQASELPKHLYSEAATFLLTTMLQDQSRVSFLEQLVQQRDQLPIAFKTGTSYGLRDAWAIAYTPRYTVAVWFGRADGGPHPKLIGLSSAAPVALELQRVLSKNIPAEQLQYIPPPTVRKTLVCSLSGATPCPHCLSTKFEWCIPKVWRTTPCSLHKLRDGKIEVVWPPELEDFQRRRFALQDYTRRAVITSPLPTTYLVSPGAKDEPVALKAEAVAYPVYWYINDQYWGEQQRSDEQLYFFLSGGKHHISLLDAEGRIAKVSIEVVDLGKQQK